jgi:hypothetical protein
MRTSSSGTDRTRAGTIALVIAIGALLAACMTSTLNASADGPIAPMAVKGFIYDESFEVVEDADVTVTTKNGETVVAFYATTSGPDGYYQITFGTNEFDFGYTIEVVATDGVLQNTNTTIAADDALWNWVNVTLVTEIPEFGGIYGLSMVFAVSGIMAIFVIIGRKKR